MYIEDIPETSLAENTVFTVINKRTDENVELLDVLIGEIEIASDIVTPEVSLVPPQMILPIELR